MTHSRLVKGSAGMKDRRKGERERAREEGRLPAFGS